MCQAYFFSQIILGSLNWIKWTTLICIWQNLHEYLEMNLITILYRQSNIPTNKTNLLPLPDHQSTTPT